MWKVKLCGHLEKFQTKKTLKFHLEISFNNFKKEKTEKFYVDCYNILTFGIGIVRFHYNIIRELEFLIILHLFLLYIFLEGKYYIFFTFGFFP